MGQQFLFLSVNNHAECFALLAEHIEATSAEHGAVHVHTDRHVDDWKAHVAGAVRESQCTVLVVWGGAWPEQRFAIAYALAQGARILYVESGRRIGTLQVALEGLYVRNTRLFGWESATPLTETFLALARGEIALRDDAHAEEAEPLDDLSPSFVLFPMQVDGDLQITDNSPRYRHILHALADTYAATQAAGLPLVVKAHPLEESDIAAEVARLCPAARWVNYAAPLSHLLESCLAVVTVNSTVGIDAMYYHKPVIALGESEYARPALVLLPDTERTLFGLLRRLRFQRGQLFASEDSRRRFLAHLWNEMVPFSPWENHIGDVAQRMIELVEEAQ